MGKIRIPYVKLSVVEAMSRVIPQYDPDSRTSERKILTAKVKEKPGFYAVHPNGFKNPAEGIIITIDVDEYLAVYKQMIEDNTAILAHIEKFQKEYLSDIETRLRNNLVIKEGESLDLVNNQHHRLYLIRHFFGLSYKDSYMRTSVDTPMFTEEDLAQKRKIKHPVIDWIKNTLLKGYRCSEDTLKYYAEDIANGKKSLEDYQDIESLDELATSLALPLSNPDVGVCAHFAASSFSFCSAGISPNSLSFAISVFSLSENSEGYMFPCGDKELDMKRFHELERLMNTIRENPNVTSMFYQPGRDVLINPTYERADTAK